MIYVQSASATANYYLQSASSSAVDVASAVSALQVNPRARFVIQDSAANVEKYIDTLKKISNNISSITLTDTSPTVMRVSSAQLLQNPALFAKMNVGGASNPVSLSVSDVLSKDAAAVGANSKVSQFSVKDTAANISAMWSGVNSGVSKLGNVQLTDPANPLKITFAQYSNAKDTLLTHFKGTYAFSLSGAKVADALTTASDDRVTALAITDHAQAIANALDDLKNLGLKVKMVTTDDTSVLKVSAEKLRTDSAVIGKLYKGYQLAVFNVDLSTAARLKSNQKVVSLDIADTADNISANLGFLNKLGASLHSLTVTDAAELNIGAADFFRNGQALAKIADPVTGHNTYQLNILDAHAVDAKVLQSNSHVHTIAVKDSSAAIGQNFDDLNSNSLVTGIKQSGPAAPLSITVDQFDNDTNALALLRDSHSFAVRGVTAARAKALLADRATNNVASVSVTDTRANLYDKLNDLTGLGKSLTSIVQDTTGQTSAQQAFQLTASEWMKHIGTLSKIVGGYGVNVSSVSATKAMALATDLRVRSIQVTDTGAAIAANLDALQAVGSKLSGIAQTDSTALQISGAQYAANTSTLGKLADSYTLSVSKASASQVSALAGSAHVQSIGVVDTVAHIASNLAAIQTAATAAGGPALTVALSGPSAAFTLSKTQLSDYADALNTIQGNYAVKVTGLSVTDAVGLAGNGHVVGMAVNASSTELSDVSQLGQLGALGGKLSSIAQSDAGTPLTLAQEDWLSNRAILAKAQGYSVALTGVKAASADNLLTNNPQVVSVAVTDTAAEISRSFNQLAALGASLQGIAQAAGDAGNLQLSMAQWTAGESTVEKISGDYHVDISRAGAEQAQSLVANDKIASVGVLASALDVSTQLADLMANSKVSSLQLSDPVNPIAMSMEQLVNDGQGNNLLGKIQGGYRLALSGVAVSDLSAARAQGHVASMEVSGTAGQIQAGLPALMGAGPRLTSLTLTGADPSVVLDYSEFQKYNSVLGMIKQPFSLVVNKVTASGAEALAQNTVFNVSMGVRDTAANISTNLNTLANLGAQITTLQTTEASPVLNVSAAQFSTAQGTLNKIKASDGTSNYQLAVTGGDSNFVRGVLADAAALAHVQSLDFADSALNIANNFDLLQSSKVTAVRLTTSAPVLTLNASQYALSASLAKIKTSFGLNVTGAAVNAAATLQADQRVNGFEISASAAQIGASLYDLLGLSKLTHLDITQSAGPTALMSIIADQYLAVQDSLGKVRGNYALNVTNVSTAALDSISGHNNVAGVQVSGTSAEVASAWDALVALGDQLTGVQFTGADPLAITLEQWNQSASALSKLPAGKALALLDVAPDEATNAAAYSNVTTVAVKGTASQVATAFDDLVALGAQLDDIELTDPASPLLLTQSQADAGAAVLAKINGGFDLQIQSA